jgi:uncharacterized membrane protein YkoI
MKIKTFLKSIFISFVFLPIIFAKVITPVKLSSILNNLQQQGYNSFIEIEQKYNVYEIDAYDVNGQECKIRIDKATGSLITLKVIKPKKSMLEIIDSLEKKGYQINEIELETKNSSIYYKVKVTTVDGKYKKLYIQNNAD